MGIQTDKHDSIAGIVYREPNGEVLSFPLETTNRKAKVVLRIAVYDIVSLKTKVLGSQKIEMIFKYVYHFNLINPVRHEKRITLEFNPRTANFEAIDHDTSRVITQAYASSHYEDGRLKGIDEIRTQ